MENQQNFGGAVYENFGPGGSGSRLKKTLEFMIYFVGFLGTILTIPVAYRIWTSQNAIGEYMASWIALTLFTPFWILYGVVNRKKSLVMTYVVWFIINLLVVLGIWIFG